MARERSSLAIGTACFVRRMCTVPARAGRRARRSAGERRAVRRAPGQEPDSMPRLVGSPRCGRRRHRGRGACHRRSAVRPPARRAATGAHLRGGSRRTGRARGASRT